VIADAGACADTNPRADTLSAVDPDPGEQVFFHGHPSWRSLHSFYLKGLLVAVLAGAAAGFLSAVFDGAVRTGWVILAVLVVFVVVLLGGLLKRARTTYTITNQRLTVDFGLLAKELHETRLERVQNVNCRQTPLERILHIGTVQFDTAGGAEYDFAFRGVAAPRQVVRTVDQALRDLSRSGSRV
jgi:uncharacterized membrane protein YdbT with pleckstrin-like domain